MKNPPIWRVRNIKNMDKDEFWAKLDLLDEDKVRENIGLGLYGEKKKKWAKEWLRKKDQER